jgi:hypothetical protein
MNPKLWRFLRLRPQNFPHIRIAQLAMLYYEQKLNFSSLIAAETEKDLHELFSTQVSEYWQTHYSFNTESSKPSKKNLSSASKNLLIINTVAPLLFAYGRYKGSEELCERSLNFLQQQNPNPTVLSALGRMQECIVNPPPIPKPSSSSTANIANPTTASVVVSATNSSAVLPISSRKRRSRKMKNEE